MEISGINKIRTLARINIMTFLMGSAISAHAAGGLSTGNPPVHGSQSTQAENGMVVIALDQPIPAGSTDGCTATSAVVMANTAIEGHTLALAMPAQATGRAVQDWLSGCTTIWGQSLPTLINFTVQ